MRLVDGGAALVGEEMVLLEKMQKGDSVSATESSVKTFMNG